MGCKSVTPRPGGEGGIQPEDHERDKLNDDPAREAGARNA